MDDLNFVESNILHLLENNYKQLEDTGKALDDKTQQIITISSLIVGLIGAFNLAQGKLPDDQKGLFVALVITYLTTFALCFLALFPRKWLGEPLKPDWTEYQRVVKKELYDYYEWLVASYIQAITTNNEVNHLKARDVELAIGSVAVQVVIVLIVILKM